MEYIIEWTGSIFPSKKNSKQLRKNFKTWRMFIASSDKYTEWEQWFVQDIQSLWYTLGKVKSLDVTIYAPNKRKFDLDNKLSSLLDGLTKSGFLDDDNYEHIGEISIRFGWVEKEWRVVMIFEKDG